MTNLSESIVELIDDVCPGEEDLPGVDDQPGEVEVADLRELGHQVARLQPPAVTWRDVGQEDQEGRDPVEHGGSAI